MYKIHPDSDQEIIDAIRGKNRLGWELLFARYDPLIQSIARWPKWNLSEDEQQDVCQNIHMHLQTALPTFRQQSSLSWFIKKIAMRQCVNEIRRQKRWRTVMTPSMQKTTDGNWNEMEFASTPDNDPYNEAVQHERQRLLESALQHLQQTCKDSIRMFYLQHLSYREMSEQLGIAVNTVGSRLSKCLDKLHHELRQHPSFERAEQ